jgi:DNA gyrase subunit B
MDLTKLRYHRVIIMTDADVDGAHIRTLLLTFFFRYYRELIDSGYLYIAQPPLYRAQSGKDVAWLYSDKELDDFTKRKDGKSITLQRYKGLGEMNADQLWQTTMDADRRRLLQVRVDDAVESEEIFSTLMGESVEARRKFISDHALDATNLDI